MEAAPPDYRRKIVPADELVPVLAAARRAGRTVVQCHGCFDIVHPGHIRYLQFARQQGDLLVVSITGDAAIDKGDARPYIPQELRAENLAALEFVDHVVIDANPTACALLSRLAPDVYVKGQEYASSNHAGFLAERAAVESHGGRVVFSSGDVVFSSTRLIETLRPHVALERRRLESLCGRHGLSLDRVSDYLDAMRGKRVLIVGDVAVDRYVVCEADGVADEAPVMALRVLDQRPYCGAAAAVALQAAALGASVMLVTTFGTDEQSAWLERQLTTAGVEVTGFQTRRTAAVRTRYLVDEQKTCRVDEIDLCPLDSLGERQAAEALLEQARLADVALFCDAGYGTITPGLVQRLGASFHQRCATLVGSVCDRRGDLSMMRHLSLCVCPERRLRGAMGNAGAGLSSVAYQWMSQTQARRLLVTMGKRGMVAFDRPTYDPAAPEWSGRLKSEPMPALSGTPRDRLGCTETAAGTAALAEAVGATLMQTAYLASAAAAIQVERMGQSPVDAATLTAWLERRAELRSDEGEVDPAVVGHSEDEDMEV